MTAYQLLFNIALYLSEGLMIFYYAKAFFNQRFNTAVSLVTILSGHMILLGIYLLNNPILNLVSLFIAYCLIFSVLYKTRFVTVVFNAVLLLAIMIASEWVVLFVTSLLVKNGFNSYDESVALQLFDVTVSKLLYYFICLVLIQIFSKRKRADERKSVFPYLLIMPVSSIAAMFVFRYVSLEVQLSDTANILCTAVSILLLVSNVIVFFIYEYSLTNAAELYELKAIEQKQQIDKNYLDILEQNNKDLKIFTHDIKNHLEQISNLTDDENINRYISELYGTVNRYGNVAMSGNKTLDVIISKYKSLCENKGISISFNVKTSNLSNINSTDLSTILNNVLDNAVEAAEKSKDANIAVDIFSKVAFDVVKIQNRCDDPPQTLGKKLITSKKEKSLHGLGIESVTRTLKKYDGMLDWSYDDQNKIFETTIAIPKSE